MNYPAVHVLVYFVFNLVSSVLGPFQIGKLRWCEMMIELDPSFQNRTGRQNHNLASFKHQYDCGFFSTEKRIMAQIDTLKENYCILCLNRKILWQQASSQSFWHFSVKNNSLLEPVCCKKQKKNPDQLLICRIGDFWRFWMA